MSISPLFCENYQNQYFSRINEGKLKNNIFIKSLIEKSCIIKPVSLLDNNGNSSSQLPKRVTRPVDLLEDYLRERVKQDDFIKTLIEKSFIIKHIYLLDNNRNLSSQPPERVARPLTLPEEVQAPYERAKKTDSHKRLASSLFVVPRERFIKEQLAKFLAPVEPSVRGYNGEAPARYAPPTPRTRTYQAVNSLYLLSGLVPDMKNGHVTSFNQKSVQRCLTIADRVAGIVGAIYFRINLETKVCEVVRLQVDDSRHNRHFGATLLQTACIISLLYDCSKIKVNSLPTAEGFYQGQGFEIIFGGYFELNFQNSRSREQFENKARKTSPGFEMQSLMSEAEEKKKQALSHLS